MKLFSVLSLLVLTSTLTSCSPVASADGAVQNPAELVKRSSCTVKNGGKSYHGTCVDVRKGKQCQGGLLVTGFCGGGNTNICCVQGYLIGKPKATEGMGSKPGAKEGMGSKPTSGMGNKPARREIQTQDAEDIWERIPQYL